ncbi:hypothetical protein CLONEX_02515 [[Clostridium] nexile DSM 1787]|nr:hypothetical protein CLONEX_02515 [[Clostridium] nexile DSM 1787]
MISIHAPKRGATRVVACKTYDRRYFNPRFHEGSDKSDGTMLVLIIISIHASTRGATCPT